MSDTNTTESDRADQQPAPGQCRSFGDVAAPVRPGGRIVTIDILRGFAIFGILLVNMQFFNQSVYRFVAGAHVASTPWDQVAHWFIGFFAHGKFYSIFSFLFGLGMALQLGRAEERDARFAGFWMRRMIVLFGFGVIHAYFFWPGDILIMYSVLGVALLCWRNARPRTLLVWAAVFLLIPLLINATLTGLVKLGEMAGGADEMAGMFQEQIAEYVRRAEQAERVYASGGFLEITAERVREMNFMFSVWPFMMFSVMAMMLLGLYAGRRGILDDVPEQRPLIRRIWLWGLIVGLIGNFMFVFFAERSALAIPSGMGLLSSTGQLIGAPALALFYMTTLTIVVEHVAWRRRLQPLAYVGRMALTNYLLQTLICVTLFFGTGFGWYGKLDTAGGMVVTAAIFVVNILFSRWWLQHFRFGPMEWVWRTLSYGRWQPVRLQGS